MTKLLKADFYRLRHSRSFYVSLIVMVAVSVLSVLFVRFSLGVLDMFINNPDSIEDTYGTFFKAGFDEGMETGGQYASIMFDEDVDMNLDAIKSDDVFRNVRGFNAIGAVISSGETLAIFFTIFICGFINTEFSSGTMQNMISKGCSRTKIYLSKLITVSVAGLAIYLTAVVVSVVMGMIMFGVDFSGRSAVLVAETLIGLAVLHIALASLITMVCFLVRNNGGCIAICLVLFLLLSPGIQLIVIAVGNAGIARYWILTPVYQLVNFSQKGGDFLKDMLVAAGYIVIPTLLGCISFNKRIIR